MFSSLVLVLLIAAAAWIFAGAGLAPVIGIVLPYAAVAVFTGGMIWRIVYWARSPVPFCIPVTGGQEYSLSFIKQARIDCPSTIRGVTGRMFLEIFLFRSLFRNTSAHICGAGHAAAVPRPVYYSSRWLWCISLVFHYSVLVIAIRHFRFFIEPVPAPITWIEALDGLMQVGSPRFYWTGGLALGALVFLFLRRVCDHKLRYISLFNDYFPLWLLLGIVLSGLVLRYWDKTEIAQVKIFLMALVRFMPSSARGINELFFVHLALVCTLLIVFPFSKLAHMPGIFFSPTRNMPNNSRAVRHINPWNPPKEYFTYPEYEDTYRQAMAEAGLPLDKSLKKAAE